MYIVFLIIQKDEEYSHLYIYENTAIYHFFIIYNAYIFYKNRTAKQRMIYEIFDGMKFLFISNSTIVIEFKYTASSAILYVYIYITYRIKASVVDSFKTIFQFLLKGNSRIYENLQLIHLFYYYI